MKIIQIRVLGDLQKFNNMDNYSILNIIDRGLCQKIPVKKIYNMGLKPCDRCIYENIHSRSCINNCGLGITFLNLQEISLIL